MSSLGWAVRVDAVAAVVDGYVVVPPAQGGEVLNVVGPKLTAGNQVVDFEPVPAAASVDGAAVVTVEHQAAYLGWDYPSGGTNRQRDP